MSAYADVVNGFEGGHEMDDDEGGMASMAIGMDEEEGMNGFGGRAGTEGGRPDRKGKGKDKEPSECILDLREHDINYYLRVAIDLSEFSVALENFSLTRMARRPCRFVVHREISRRHDVPHASARKGQASRTRRHGVRYRNVQTATKVSRPAYRSNYDDFVHD